MAIAPSPYDFLEPADVTRGNVTAAVTDRLRRAIVTLALQPGEVLDKSLICERLGVSRFPVSEAFARLQAEGLVDIAPQRGSTVSLVRLAEVSEYFLIRKALECEALRVLLGNRPAALSDQLEQNLAAQRLANEADDHEGFHQLDLDFHDLLFASMRFDRIRGVIDSTRANLDRARRLVATPRRLTLTLGEHQSIADAIAAGDPASAQAAMRTHLDAVMHEVFALAHQHAEFFADGGRHPANGPADFPFG